LNCVASLPFCFPFVAGIVFDFCLGSVCVSINIIFYCINNFHEIKKLFELIILN
jgi:hypothetical protein